DFAEAFLELVHFFFDFRPLPEQVGELAEFLKHPQRPHFPASPRDWSRRQSHRPPLLAVLPTPRRRAAPMDPDSPLAASARPSARVALPGPTVPSAAALQI